MINLKNRFLMAPIKLGYSDDSGTVLKKHFEFYKERVSDLGAVTLEPLYMNKGLREIPTQLGIDEDGKIEGLSKLVRMIHDNGSKVIAHLNHPGRLANPKIPGNYFISSTFKACENGGAQPKRMTEQDMDAVIGQFKASIKRAEKASFDIIEIQFGHGYLFAQYLSPSVNDRDDEYGGSFENRIRFPLRAFDEIRTFTKLPIIIRLSGEEMIPNGIRLEEMKIFAKILEEHGADAIHVTAGSGCSTPPWFFQHMFVPKGKTWEFAREIKKNVSIPVIFVGKINTFEDIDMLISEYKADYLAIGRGLVADPKFISKYLGRDTVNRDTDIYKPCLACSEGCLGGVKSGEGLHCVVNPQIGEFSYTIEPASAKKHIAIVGGGLAGLEAAVTLKERGHEPVIFEKDKLGGQFNLAFLPPNKESLKKLIDYYREKVRLENIKIVEKEATADDIIGNGFDEAIIATGARPAIPPIDGLKEYYWAEVLEDENIFENRSAVVIGGGLIGIEVAHKLIKKGNRVIIVEMLDEIARGMEMIEKALTLKNLKEHNVPVYTGYLVTKVEGDVVTIKDKHGNTKKLEGIDHIIVATGMKSYNPLEPEIKGKVPYHVIGDAHKVGKAQGAIKEAFETALTI